MRRIGLEISSVSDCCPRCDRELLLVAELPSPMTNGRGEAVGGTVHVPLCGTCDVDTPNAGPLIAFLTVHEQVTEDLAAQFAAYVQDWVRGLEPPVVDQQAWDADFEAWQRGDFAD